MKYNQQAVDDLLSPLRYVNLKDIDPNSINRIGEGVFPELTTLDHLSILDLVTKAYQAIHLPTYGRVIPGQTTFTSASLTTSATSVDLFTVPVNQTWRIMGISSKNRSDYEMTAASLVLNGKDILALGNIDTLTAAYGGVITDINDNLIITGGSTLSLTSAAAPNDDVIFEICYDLHQQ